MNEDLIRRSDVLNLATCITKPTYDSPYCESVVYIEDIEAIPSVDAEPVRYGEWENYPSHSYRRCSICKMEWEKPRFNTRLNYCPNCGAKMDKGVQNDQN